jgi:signal transduction histidine kinase/CheY-like chemotaxis protein
MKPRLSLRLHFLIGCFIAILGSAMFAYIEFSQVAGTYALQAVQGRADALTSDMARVLARLLAADPAAKLEDTVSPLEAETDFRNIQVRDQNGATLLSIGSSADSDVYIAKSDLTNNGRKFGTVALTVSLDRMRTDLERTCRSDFYLVLAVGVLAMLLVYRLIIRLVIKPLGRLQLATNTLAEGGFPPPVEVGRADELGALTTQFNQMAQQLESDSAIRKLMHDLEIKTEQAEAASRAKSEFLANMSHEIRTPMNGILGMTQLALRTKLDADQKDYLSTIRSSGESLLAILNDILDFSKIEAREMTLDPVPFSLREHVLQVIKAISGQADERNLELVWRIGPDVPDALIGDALRLRQVLLNLLTNALKFTAEGEIVLAVDLPPASSSPDQVRLRFSVQDTGIGIPFDKLETIFEAFKQADGSTTRRFGGTGLGLAICRTIVELLGGEISVSSEVGKGSNFSFSASFIRGVEIPRPVDYSELESAEASASPGVRVLAVDDNGANLRILGDILDGWKIRADLVMSGSEALDAIQLANHNGRPYSMLLLASRMPGLGGVELVEELRHSDVEIPACIMLLSSTEISDDADRFHSLGIQHQLVKPISTEDLRQALLQGLGGTLPADSPLRLANSSAGILQDQSLRPLEILLAEDNEVNRRVATRLLEREGHRITAAANGLKALEMTQQHAFDLVLMDVQMPHMDGFQATAAIREWERTSGRHVPIVAMTANAMKGDRELCLDAGMDGYVSKPINMEELRREIISVMKPAVVER